MTHPSSTVLYNLVLNLTLLFSLQKIQKQVGFRNPLLELAIDVIHCNWIWLLTAFACWQPNCHIAGSEFQSALHQLYWKSSHFNWHCRKIMNTVDTSFFKWWWRWIVFVVWLIDEKHLALFSVRSICHRSPPSRFWHTMGRVLTCPEPEIWLSLMKLNYTMAKLLLWT